MQTTDTKPRIPLPEADALAAEVLELLRPATEQIAIAGSVRRRRPDPADIEICAVPRFDELPQEDLFGAAPALTVNRLDELVAQLLVEDVLHGRLDKNGRAAIGSKLKRLVFKGCPLDIFTTGTEGAAGWGVLMAVRTGPAAYSHAFVTPRGQQAKIMRADGFAYRPGLLPPGMRVEVSSCRLYGGDGRVIPTPTEEAFFDAIGQPVMDPWRRK